MLKQLRLVCCFMVYPMIHAAAPGWYGGVIGSRGALYDTGKENGDDAPEVVHRISSNQSGLFVPTWQFWDMSYIRYQHSNQFAIIMIPRQKFSADKALQHKTRIGTTKGYNAYLADVVGAVRLLQLKRSLNIEGQVGLWGAQSDAIILTSNAEGYQEEDPCSILGYGPVIGIGANWEFSPRFLLEGSYKGLWSFSRMKSTTMMQVGISYRVV